MTNNHTEGHSLIWPPTGDIRQAEFEQRKRDYIQTVHDRPAVFIEPPKKYTDDFKPGK
jgi:hypothetical protein